MKRHYYHLLLIAAALLLWNCAQVAPLTGGPRDNVPPRLVEALPQNASVNFSENIVTLSFNEYIQLKDLQNQLIITPSLKTTPEIIAEGKKVKIKLKPEELESNTTYRFFFGRAIVDMTEGNPSDGFQYVFSTGSTIDSLKLKGIVSDATNNNPVSDAIVMLYPENASDSSVFKSAPQYIGKTNAAGKFELNYLPEKAFRVYAVRDKNKNYRYDGEQEQIAFMENSFTAGKDSSLALSMFSESAARHFIKKTYMPNSGLIHVIYNRKGMFDVGSLRRDVNFMVKEPQNEKDTISIYYHSSSADSIAFAVKEISSGQSDTVRALIPKINPKRKKSLFINTNLAGSALAYKQPLKLFFSSMPDTNTTLMTKISLIQKTDSTSVAIPFSMKYKMPAEAFIMAPLNAGSSYIFKIDTGAFSDFNGRYNDSVAFSFKTQTKEELGKLTLNLSVSKKQSYIIQLISEQEKVIAEEHRSFSLSSSSSVSIDFIDLLPGAYKVKVVFDDNKNRKWDSGNVIKKVQPEKIFIHPKQIKVLSDWELEEEVKVN